SEPRANHVRNAETARTSFEVVDGRSSPSSASAPLASDWTAPVAFSLRRKQSTIRSPRLYKRPERRLYSGNIPTTFTRGSDRSRWPAFKWQLAQETLLGVKRGASAGVLVKIRYPHRMSLESFESSSVRSASGFLGISHAVTIVVREEISGPLSILDARPGPCEPKEQPATDAQT